MDLSFFSGKKVTVHPGSQTETRGNQGRGERPKKDRPFGTDNVEKEDPSAPDQTESTKKMVPRRGPRVGGGKEKGVEKKDDQSTVRTTASAVNRSEETSRTGTKE